MSNMNLCSLIFAFCASIFIFSTVKCATFKNVIVTLRTNLVQYEEAKQLFIPSTNKLSTVIKPVDEKKFEILDVNNQKIPKLTENSVADLRNIRVIEMSRCGIKEIEPGTFKNLPNLFYLDLSKNSLETIKIGVFSDLEVHTLDLSYNKISKWNGKWVWGSKLQHIRLYQNRIKEIPANSLAYIKPRYNPEQMTISIFNVENNKLKKIHPKAFSRVHSMDLLSLGNNSLSEISVKVFANTQRFGQIDLTFNNLKCFPLDILNVTKVEHVELTGNPLTCDCVKKWSRKKGEARRLFGSEELGLYKFKCVHRSE